jgi:DNA polymerase III epsilon subunit-like protein
MKIIVFDTETSGLPCVGKQTTIVQFSYVIYDCEKNEIIKEVDRIITQPVGFIIPNDSISIHHITNEMCSEQGVDLMNILNDFINDTRDCYRVIGHNVQFDIRMILMSLKNEATPTPFELKHVNRKIRYVEMNIIPKLYCTMMRGIELCKLPKMRKTGEIMTSYKYPKLSELHVKLFGDCPNGLHNALVDVNVCLRCYIAMNTYM